MPGVAGTWKDLTDNVNLMAINLTDQVRGIVKVVTAVANGDLTKKFVVEAKGEIAALADTINDMTDTLRTFAEQVTTVAREVGIEGKLGGQAKVPGAAGTWRDLTDNVNQLAGNLTTQVRAISEVATAVIKGDLTRTIDRRGAGRGAVAQGHDQPDDREPARHHADEQGAGLAEDEPRQVLADDAGPAQPRVARAADHERADAARDRAARHVLRDDRGEGARPARCCVCSPATGSCTGSSSAIASTLGEGLVGQCALEKETILVDDVPDGYVAIGSSIGHAPPRNIVVLPVLFEGQIKGVIELASFQKFSPIHITFLEQLMLSIGVVFNMITASMRTEELLEELKGSQRRAREAHATSSRRRPRCSRSRTARSRRPAPRSRRRRASSRWSPSTSPSSSPTCRTSCARRSTAC